MLKTLTPCIASRRVWTASRQSHRFQTLSYHQHWQSGLPNRKPEFDRGQYSGRLLSTTHRGCMFSHHGAQKHEVHKNNGTDPPYVKQSKPIVEVIGHSGQKIQREINASYPEKPRAVKNLLKMLSSLSLLASPSGTAYNSHGWELDSSGRILHRYASFKSSQDAERARREIQQAASELKHDPHICEDFSEDTSLPYMLISCTTHHPVGLSLKDAKLAAKVDEILESIGERDDTKDVILSDSDMLARRKEVYTYNLTAIEKDCTCATSHEGTD